MSGFDAPNWTLFARPRPWTQRHGLFVIVRPKTPNMTVSAEAIRALGDPRYVVFGVAPDDPRVFGMRDAAKDDPHSYSLHPANGQVSVSNLLTSIGHQRADVATAYRAEMSEGGWLVVHLDEPIGTKAVIERAVQP